MNFWNNRAFQPRQDVRVPPQQFPWNRFARPNWQPPGMQQPALPWMRNDVPDIIRQKREAAGLGPLGPRPGLGAGRPVDRNPNKPGLGWGGLNPNRGGGNLNRGNPYRGQDGPDILNHNIRHGLNDNKSARLFRQMLGQGADFITMQEMGSGDLRRRFAQIARRNGYGFTGHKSSTGTPIAFKRGGDYRILDAGKRRIMRPGYVGPGAGPDRLGAKYANYIVARDKKTGKERAIINMHASASQQHALRNKLAKQQFRIAGDLGRDLERKYGKDLMRVIVGDMNTSKVGKMRKHMGREYRAFAPKGSTFKNKARIDWFMTDQRMKNLTRQDTISDHHLLGANFGGGGRGRPMDRNPNKPGLGWGGLNPKRKTRPMKRYNPRPPRARM
jgi:hypothetical protein